MIQFMKNHTVQYWYKISDDISRKCGMISTVIK